MEKELVKGRVGVHFLYDDLILLIERLKDEFKDEVKISSIGKSY